MRVFHLIFRSRLTTVAALSVVILLTVLVFQARQLFTTLATPSTFETPEPPRASFSAEEQQEMLLLGLTDSVDPTAVASSTDPIEMIGPVVVAQLIGQYAGLLDSGAYSSEAVVKAAESIAPNVRAAITYKTYTSQDFQTDTNTSFDRMLTYRSDLREALAPLLDNKESELELYAKYFETSDDTYLKELEIVAKNYRLAADAAAALTIPRDAVNYHRDIVNAMEQFAATLDAMIKYPEDTFASIALLRSYNAAEEKMFFSFDSLGSYYSQKTP